MINEICKYIFSIILALGIFVLIICGIASDTILKKEYIFSVFDEIDYYQKVYDLTYENFSIYVMQSGFNEDIFDGIVTLDKVKNDTQIIFTDIYDGKNDEVNLEVVKENLRSNINNYLEKSGVKAEEKSLKMYEDVISEQYRYSVNYHTSVIETLSKGVNTAKEIISRAEVFAKLAIAVSLFMIIILNIRNNFIIVNSLGVCFLFLGVLSISFKLFIDQFFNFDVLLVINRALTDLLEFLLNSIYSKLLIYGIVFGIIGLCLIVLGSINQTKRKSKVNKDSGAK